MIRTTNYEYLDKKKSALEYNQNSLAYLHQNNVELIDIKSLLSKGNLIAWELVESKKKKGGRGLFRESALQNTKNSIRFIKVMAIYIDHYLNNDIRYIILHTITLFHWQSVPFIFDNIFKYLKV